MVITTLRCKVQGTQLKICSSVSCFQIKYLKKYPSIWVEITGVGKYPTARSKPEFGVLIFYSSYKDNFPFSKVPLKMAKCVCEAFHSVLESAKWNSPSHLWQYLMSWGNYTFPLDYPTYLTQSRITYVVGVKTLWELHSRFLRFLSPSQLSWQSHLHLEPFGWVIKCRIGGEGRHVFIQLDLTSQQICYLINSAL